MTDRVLLTAIALMASAGIMAQQEKGLKDAYRDCFTVGVSVNQRNVTTPSQMALIFQEFNSITAENDMKPEPTEPQEGVFRWERADRIANFCRSQGIKMRGHCLVWHNQIGKWMFDDNGQPASKELLLKRMRSHIHEVVSRYKDVVYAWDVVNEAMTDDPHAENPYRPSVLYKIAGEDFIRKAFEYAREADPDALLFYNDYNETNPMKCERICQMVRRMRAEGVPIDGIGMQGHYNTVYPTEELLDAAIRKYKEVVGHIHVTELDVRMTNETGGQLEFGHDGVADSAAVARQASQYDMLFRVFRRHSDIIDNVTFWNLSDRDSWLGVDNAPLLFDKDYRPKEAYQVVVNISQ